MKRNKLVSILMLSGLIVTLPLSFSSCTSSGNAKITQNNTTTYTPTVVTTSPDTENEVTTSEITTAPEATTLDVTTAEVTTESVTTEEITTAEVTTEAKVYQYGYIPTHIEGAELIGTTSKGYDVEVKDGVTYVGGILIANKTYALPSSYHPEIYKSTDWTTQLLDEAAVAFDAMNKAFKSENPSEKALKIQSGFRSYTYQDNLYTKYYYDKKKGPAWAEAYSARPGHSEHQTGLGADINYAGIYTLENDTFTKTVQYKWLIENSWRYGYILRYPEGKETETGYNFESWHFRYVGTEAAKAIYESGLCLEEFLGIDSVYGYDYIPENTTTTTPVTTKAPQTTSSPLTTASPVTTTEPQTTKIAETTAAPVETTETPVIVFEPKHIKGSEKIGVSATGYDIEQLNGITYVGGVLVVNKQFSYPSSAIPQKYKNYSSTTFMLTEAQTAFNKMKADYKALYPNATGFKIFIAYRSYSYQQETYDYFVNLLGLEKANARAATPGHSEHHSGLCCDVELDKSGYTCEILGDSPEGKWLEENSWRYGFILRYPDGYLDTLGYQYEPWHYTYVGLNAAGAIYQSGLCFEEFLGIVDWKQDETGEGSSAIDSSGINSSAVGSSSINSSSVISSSIDSSAINSSAVNSSAVDSSSIDSSVVDSSSIKPVPSSSIDSTAILQKQFELPVVVNTAAIII